MKKTAVGVVVLISIFLVSVFSTQFFIKPYFFPTWQGDNDSSCDEEIRNPLCEYSVDLKEIPNVSLLELAQSPQKYNDTIIRVQGRYYSELEDYFDSRLYSISNNEIGRQTLQSIGVWNNKVNETLCHFIDLNSPETSQADVTLIVRFHYETSNLHGRLERNHNNPLQFTILRVEDMKPVLGNSGKQNLQPRQHKEKFCTRIESIIDFD